MLKKMSPILLITVFSISVFNTVSGQGATCESKWQNWGVQNILNIPVPANCQGMVDFGSICSAHDQCYSTCGQNKYQCDKQFEFALESKCRGIPRGEQVCKAVCEKLEDMYSESAEKFGWNVFSQAQQPGACRSGQDPKYAQHSVIAAAVVIYILSLIL